MDRTALYAGSFDPFTNGHLNIVQRGLQLFDKIEIVVAVSPNKKSLIPMKERQQIIQNVFVNEPRVNVSAWGGLLVDYAQKHKIHFILRGLRPTGDFENEFQMASMNKHLYENIETFFLTTSEDHYYVSSSLVKEVFNHGGAVDDLVPPEVLKYLKSL